MSGLRSIGARLRGGGDLIPVATFVFMVVLFYVVPSLDGKDVEWSSGYAAMQTVAAYGLLALALGLGMVAGIFDLSVLGMFALGGMLAVKTGGDAPLLGVLVAIATGVLAGVVQGTIVARLKLDSISVSLGGYLVLLGLSRAIGSDESVPYPDVNVGIELDKPILEVFSWHSLAVLVCFVVLGLLLRYTRIGRDVRAVGGDQRASRVAGVRVDRVLIGVFAVSGALSGIAGALNSYSLASAIPDPGFAPLVFGATAALIGGVAFSGGRGSALGIALGALSLALLQAMFGLLASPEWVSAAVTGGLLVIAAVAAAPRIADHAASLRARFRAPRRQNLPSNERNQNAIS
jgi:ribose/xylose/arabinose/galactoside ABC-type transport system permease subunit